VSTVLRPECHARASNIAKTINAFRGRPGPSRKTLGVVTIAWLTPGPLLHHIKHFRSDRTVKRSGCRDSEVATRISFELFSIELFL
jgi:hypothetical protein